MVKYVLVSNALIACILTTLLDACQSLGASIESIGVARARHADFVFLFHSHS